MLKFNTVFDNSNLLTHHWEPKSTSQTLDMDEEGRIKITPNHQSLIKSWPKHLKQSIKTKELLILIKHCESIEELAKHTQKELRELPRTNFSEYHHKITQYQGAINLLHKHFQFLSYCKKSIDSKKSSLINPLIKINLNVVSQRANEKLKAIENAILHIRATQKVNTAAFYPARVHFVAMNGDDLIIGERLSVRELPVSYPIGQYTSNEKNYKILINMDAHLGNLWVNPTIPPLNNTICITSLSEGNNEERVSGGFIKLGITWMENEHSIIDRHDPSSYSLGFESTDYINLYKTATSIKPVSPSLVIIRENINTDEPIHQQKLYQVIFEWVMRFNYDRVVVYDIPENAALRFSLGLSCQYPEHLPKDLHEQLEMHLEQRTSPPEPEVEHPSQRLLPFIFKRTDFNTNNHYDFQAGEKKPILNLFCSNPTLDNDLPHPPAFKGIPFFRFKDPLHKLFTNRSLFGKPITFSPAHVQSAPYDLSDITSEKERCSAAQLSDEELKRDHVHISRRNIVKVKLV